MVPARNFGHIHSLDGLRGFAVLLVFTYHVFLNVFIPNNLLNAVLKKIVTSGWVGVDLFFVLSGFLITTILLNARDSTNYYKVFYGRRALRIFPLYYLVLAGSLLLEPGHYPWGVQLFFWLNLSNLCTAFNPYTIGFLAHFWSLSIEEQFYMFWPWTVRRLTPRRLALLCLTIIVVLFLVRLLPVWLRLTYRYPELLYRLTPFRIDTLCGGALLAVVLKYRQSLVENNRWALRLICIVAFGVFLASGQLYTEHRVIRVGYTSLVIGFTALIALALFPDGRTSRLFSNAFLRRLGKYSYSFYLFHPFSSFCRECCRSKLSVLSQGPSPDGTVSIFNSAGGMPYVSCRVFRGVRVERSLVEDSRRTHPEVQKALSLLAQTGSLSRIDRGLVDAISHVDKAFLEKKKRTF